MNARIATSGPLPQCVDVIVVGSGAAALTGALRARSLGLSVLVLEKTEYFGGTSAYSGACLWAPGNHVLSRGGINDSIAAGREYLQVTIGDRTPAAQQDVYLQTAPQLVEFLENVAGVAYQPIVFPDYFDAPGRARPNGRGIGPVPRPAADLGDLLALLRPPLAADQYGESVERDTLVEGQALVGGLLLALRRTDVQLRLNSALRDLVIDNGRVIGVSVGPDGTTVQATAGVLVAAGGYERNAELRRRYQGLSGAQATASAPGTNTGDALVALQRAGAGIDLLDESWWTPSTLFPNGHAAFTLGLREGIIVGPEGRRIGNESLPYDRMGHVLLEQIHKHGPEAKFWWIFDGHAQQPPGMVHASVDLAAFEAAGLRRTADTVAELAAAIGVPADELSRTVEQFNEFAAAGVDTDFHRGEDDYDRLWTGGESCLTPLTGPLQALRIVLGDLGTKGGATIGTDGQVITPEGTPIGGLYAAGNSAASVAGNVYPGPGVPLASGMVFAYRAAQAMARALQHSGGGRAG